ncbi:MAG: hypothetical protein LBD47_06535, partial [Treponema sp.]|nr:hypothetical protein [Treponema sp.]
MNYRLCRRILAIVLLMSFWRIPVFGEPQTAQTRNSEESGMRQYVQSGEAGLPGKNAEHFYTESEVDTLIEDLTGAAHEAVERAAAEAARAAALASLEREASLLQAKELVVREAQRLQGENSRLKRSRVQTAVVTG